MATAKTAKPKAGQLTAYCMKTKEKNVPIQDAVINVTNGRYIAKGHDGNGNTITTILNAEKAQAAIDSENAKKGTGWAKPTGKK